MPRVLGVLLLVLCASHVIEAYNILFMLPFGSKSHKNVFDPVAEELAKRGHKVTFFSNLEDKRVVPGVRNYQSEALKDITERHDVSFFQGCGHSISFMKNIFNMLYEITDLTYSDPFIQDLLIEPNDPTTGKSKYDLLVMDAILNDFVLPIAHHMGVPSFIFSPGGTFLHQAWNLDIPYPYSVQPSPTMDLPEPMSFGQRAINSFVSFMLVPVMNNIVLPNEDAVVRKYLPNSPSILDLERNASFMISNSHPPISLRKPSMPYAKEIGGLNCRPAQSLPKDLEDYMQEAGNDGVIYFSLGSVTKGQSMPLEMRDKIIKAFAQLPQKILFKYEKEIPSLPKNVRLIKWAPQQDLLGHPQLRLFISHGGGLSTSEAAYHGCLILGFPLSADQDGNMAQAKRQGVAEVLNWKTFTTQQLVETINRMLTDKSYKEKVKRTSALLKDRAIEPVEEAAYWIEYVIRHDGAQFLKSSAGTLNCFQYFLLDVLAAFAAILIVVAVVAYYTLRLLLRLVCCSGQKLGIVGIIHNWYNCPNWCCPAFCKKFGTLKPSNLSKNIKKKNN